MNILTIVFFGLLCVGTSLQQRIRHQGWNNFRLRHGKHYDNSTEEKARFEVWSARAADIAKHNARDDVTYTRTQHFHADLLPHEFKSLLGLKLPKKMPSVAAKKPSSAASVAAPAFVDWRQSGLVTAVKDQGQCGSCWAFSSTGALEGQYFKKSKSLVSLSEQQLADCVYPRNGCDGGWMSDAFDAAKKGITGASSYPYKSGKSGKSGSCQSKSKTMVTKTSNPSSVTVGDDEDDILKAVATVGPLSIAVCVTDEFSSYGTGVFTDDYCSEPNHAVLLVGYNTSPTDGDYWIVKNSWSASWGESGYIRIARNQGLINNAIYPLV